MDRRPRAAQPSSAGTPPAGTADEAAPLPPSRRRARRLPRGRLRTAGRAPALRRPQPPRVRARGGAADRPLPARAPRPSPARRLRGPPAAFLLARLAGGRYRRLLPRHAGAATTRGRPRCRRRAAAARGDVRSAAPAPAGADAQLSARSRDPAGAAALVADGRPDGRTAGAGPGDGARRPIAVPAADRLVALSA